MKKSIRQYSFFAIILVSIGAFNACDGEEENAQNNKQDTSKDLVDGQNGQEQDASTTNDVDIADTSADTSIEPQILKAFPSSYGGGVRAITGGRGGKVLHVTRLDDAKTNDGPVEGTLRWALTQTFPRIVVFDVSGTIKLEGRFGIGKQHSDLTIAGQTAPKGGITIEHTSFGFYRTNNVIVRYLRFVHVGYFASSGPINATALSVAGVNGGIFDHISTRYSWNSVGLGIGDDNDQEDGTDNVTIQRSIFGESKTGMLSGGSATDDTRIVLAGKNSIHHNLFAHISHRFPNVAGNASTEIINNVAYNYRFRLSTFFNDSESNLINNFYKAGPSSNYSPGARVNIGDYLDGISYFTPQLYTSGNVMMDPAGDLAADYDGWENFVISWDNGNTADETTYRSATVFEALGEPIPTTSAAFAYDDVIANVGANRFLNADGSVDFYLDEVDASYIADIKNGRCQRCSGTEYVDKTDRTALLYPVLPENTRPNNYDSDSDGMPDVWENANGFDPSVDDSSEDADGDGYTNVEEFLNSVDN